MLLLYCRARLFAFVARCCVSYHGYLSLDSFLSIVACLKAMQCVKLRARGRLSYGCVFIIAPLRSVTVRFVLRELSIFLLCLDYVLWPGAASRPSAVSKFCGNLRQWAGKTAVSILILWISSVADSLEMKEMSSRYHFNKRALFSNYKPMLRIENPAIQLAPWF